MAFIEARRKVPKTRGDIDHLIVAQSGVWIADAKNYSGRVECRDVGNWRTTDLRLYVNNRDKTKLVDNFDWQIAAVRAALDPMGFGDLPVHPVLLFTEWKKGLFERRTRSVACERCGRASSSSSPTPPAR